MRDDDRSVGESAEGAEAVVGEPRSAVEEFAARGGGAALASDVLSAELEGGIGGCATS